MKKSKKEGSRLHFRRCHLCDGVTESEASPILQCGHCGKPMAPFYFFDDREVSPLSDVGIRLPDERRPNERTPIRGFTAYW